MLSVTDQYNPSKSAAEKHCIEKLLSDNQTQKINADVVREIM